MTSPFSYDLVLSDLNKMHCNIVPSGIAPCVCASLSVIVLTPFTSDPNIAVLLVFAVDRRSVHKNVRALTVFQSLNDVMSTCSV